MLRREWGIEKQEKKEDLTFAEKKNSHHQGTWWWRSLLVLCWVLAPGGFWLWGGAWGLWRGGRGEFRGLEGAGQRWQVPEHPGLCCACWRFLWRPLTTLFSHAFPLSRVVYMCAARPVLGLFATLCCEHRFVKGSHLRDVCVPPWFLTHLHFLKLYLSKFTGKIFIGQLGEKKKRPKQQTTKIRMKSTVGNISFFLFN